jgi:hypothetical protein
MFKQQNHTIKINIKNHLHFEFNHHKLIYICLQKIVIKNGHG